MKSKDLVNLTIEELDVKLNDLRIKLLKKRVLKSTGQAEDSADIKSIRRSIARAETFRRQRLGAAQS